jgi:hypothetical protein
LDQEKALPWAPPIAGFPYVCHHVPHTRRQHPEGLFMTTPHIDGVLSKLHERFAGSETSPQQEELLRKLQSQLIDGDGPKLAGDGPTVTAELLAQELEEEHPHLSAIVRELIAELGRIGI